MSNLRYCVAKSLSKFQFWNNGCEGNVAEMFYGSDTSEYVHMTREEVRVDLEERCDYSPEQLAEDLEIIITNFEDAEEIMGLYNDLVEILYYSTNKIGAN